MNTRMLFRTAQHAHPTYAGADRATTLCIVFLELIALVLLAFAVSTCHGLFIYEYCSPYWLKCAGYCWVPVSVSDETEFVFHYRRASV